MQLACLQTHQRFAGQVRTQPKPFEFRVAPGASAGSSSNSGSGSKAVASPSSRERKQGSFSVADRASPLGIDGKPERKSNGARANSTHVIDLSC